MSNFEKKSRGDKFRPAANEWNAMIDAALKAQQGDGTVPGPETREPDSPFGIAMVKNNSGARVPRFGVLGLGTPLFLPSTDLDEFKRQSTFAGSTPATGTHEGKFGILLQPLAKGKIGPAVITGAIMCKVAFSGSPKNRAEITNGSTATLTSADAGSARILWIETSGSSPRWAIVRIGDGAGACDIASATKVSMSVVTDVTGSFSGCVLTLTVTKKTITFCGTVV